MENKKTLLYIDCCIRKEASRTRRLAYAFLEAIEQQGDYDIERLLLTEEALSPLVGDYFLKREQLLEEGRLDHPRFRYARQFAAADRIVVAAPFWDLSVPALLKIYIENVSVQDITFGCDTVKGHLFGICRATKLCFLTTRGGSYEHSALETGIPFMRNLSEFFGIEQFDYVAADGIDLLFEPPETILLRAIDKARELSVCW